MTDAMTDNRSQIEKTNEEKAPAKKTQIGDGLFRLQPETQKLLKQPSVSTRRAMKVSILEIETELTKFQEARPDLSENQILRMAGSTPQQLAASRDKGEAPGYLLYALLGLKSHIVPQPEPAHIFTFDELSVIFDCILRRIREHLHSKEPEKAKELQPILDVVFKALQNA